MVFPELFQTKEYKETEQDDPEIKHGWYQQWMSVGVKQNYNKDDTKERAYQTIFQGNFKDGLYTVKLYHLYIAFPG
ncbi:hypothetical protein GCM10009122_26940 [Fulvivirga kasyanovii]